MRVALVVEDDVMVQGMLRRVLEKRGFDVRVAGNAFAAVGAVRQRPPDVVLLDIHLPGADGYLVMRWMRDVPDASGVPVVVLSSEDPLRIGADARAAGARAVLSKAAPIEVITGAIELVLSGTSRGERLH